MNSKKFGIGLIILSITLVLGITISELVKIKDIPEIETIERSIAALEEFALMNCEPEDKNLKYQILPYNEEKNFYKEIDKKVILKPIPAIKDSKKEKNISTDKEKELEEIISELHTSSEKSSAENKILLHKEVCRNL